ncbi:hypothetical protein EJB05_00877 [Eragrostis curvula]|uniref:Ubiquitin-like protease family profile domain-containing protein n=1 Tax=Eragrostis curvula TaxID=38414 RepID=A0A5J9WQJ2_9POAL|nr:hypothetical protein EJB05_00877 [Eragrostis curvula]
MTSNVSPSQKFKRVEKKMALEKKPEDKVQKNNNASKHNHDSGDKVKEAKSVAENITDVASHWTKPNSKYKPGKPLMTEEELSTTGPACIALHKFYMQAITEEKNIITCYFTRKHLFSEDADKQCHQQPSGEMCAFYCCYHMMLMSQEVKKDKPEDIKVPTTNLPEKELHRIRERFAEFIMNEIINVNGVFHLPANSV